VPVHQVALLHESWYTWWNIERTPWVRRWSLKWIRCSGRIRCIISWCSCNGRLHTMIAGGGCCCHSGCGGRCFCLRKNSLGVSVEMCSYCVVYLHRCPCSLMEKLIISSFPNVPHVRILEKRLLEVVLDRSVCRIS
jgi:hypothetical protein